MVQLYEHDNRRLNLADVNTHQVAVYFLDWDGGARSERIDVLDAASNAVLDTRFISGFQGGQYLVWNLQGHVKLEIYARQRGKLPVANGMLLRQR